MKLLVFTLSIWNWHDSKCVYKAVVWDAHQALNSSCWQRAQGSPPSGWSWQELPLIIHICACTYSNPHSPAATFGILIAYSIDSSKLHNHVRFSHVYLASSPYFWGVQQTVSDHTGVVVEWHGIKAGLTSGTLPPGFTHYANSEKAQRIPALTFQYRLQAGWL